MPITKARLRISDYNVERKHKLKEKEHRVRMVSLSLTSMVDMFAILVIFLLTNASTVQSWIEIDHGISLPKAKSADPPPKGPTIQISTEQVYGDKKPLIATNVLNQKDAVMDSIRNWLMSQPEQAKKESYVNIVGDENVQFGAIRKVIALCQDSGFKNVNLAVQPLAFNPSHK